MIRSRSGSVAQSVFLLLFAGAIAYLNQPATLAQIVPDASLGSERSNIQRDVLVNGRRSDQIEGGSQRGGNLFHSFEAFNVDNGQRVYFASPNGIDRIFSRVTGTSRSEIHGTLGVAGSADLFLLNPNGILFGRNARLDVGGSFVASSAAGVIFNDGFTFSAANPQAPPLLTISTPIGLQFRANPGGLTVRGTGHNLSYNPDTDTVRVDSPGLQVNRDQTLALIGGNLWLQGGSLRSESGQIALGSVMQPGLVRLSTAPEGYAFDYAAINRFGNIEMRDRAVADVSGTSGGAIQVQGRGVTLRSGAALLSITQGEGTGGTLSVNATDSLRLLGDSIAPVYASSITSESQGAGVSGDIVLNTQHLIMREGGLVTTYNFGGGGGDITVNATESMRLSGSGLQDSGLYAGTQAEGDSGNLTINTVELLDDRGAIFASTYGDGDAGDVTIDARTMTVLNTEVEATTFAAGDAGDLTVRATHSIILSGSVDPLGNFPGGLTTQVNPDATGRGGQLTVETGLLRISDNSFIQVATFGAGDAGGILIRAHTIELFNTPNLQGPFPRFTSINAGGNTSVIVPGLPTGDGGSLEIYADRLSLRNNTQISNFGPGTGRAGNLLISARIIELDDQSIISTETRSTNGGNITLRADLILLQNNSTITTTAGTGGAGGNGGNIAIETDFLASPRFSNSDITANAFTGRGGIVTIEAQGIFGITARPALTSESDITATSAQGVQGTITINTPIVVPIAGTVTLPTDFSSPPLAQNCQAQESRSRFVNTGRGGLPTNPADPLVAEELWQDLGESDAAIAPPQAIESPNLPPATLIEAQGWIVSPQGNMILTAAAPTAIPREIGTVTECDPVLAHE
ncbi:MAG: S-layer family protein [Leptolyngbyaceae cyanobacterium SM1_3_5]|nr:S-layer family protein [Leptolyngbyaceae cyanobacterium SM1_3_5]NJN90034.1 S-layer family protein [Leptolyngbyaceae cyanobacterium SL_5_14]